MTKVIWNETGKRRYEAGIDRAVLYVKGSVGVPWNGLVSVSERSAGIEIKKYYFDGINYLNIATSEEFEATITAFYSPKEFDQCDGMVEPIKGLLVTQQRRKLFGLTYRTLIGNDTEGTSHGYKIHLVYNALATPSDKDYETLSDNTDPTNLSWDIVTRPYAIPSAAHSAHLILDSTELSPYSLKLLEDVLYGTPETEPRLPLPSELFDILLQRIFIVTDHGDGTFTVESSDDAVSILDEDTFEINEPRVVFSDEFTYTVSSD